jgi:hypothetical protein
VILLDGSSAAVSSEGAASSRSTLCSTSRCNRHLCTEESVEYSIWHGANNQQQASVTCSKLGRNVLTPGRSGTPFCSASAQAVCVTHGELFITCNQQARFLHKLMSPNTCELCKIQSCTSRWCGCA